MTTNPLTAALALVAAPFTWFGSRRRPRRSTWVPAVELTSRG